MTESTQKIQTLSSLKFSWGTDSTEEFDCPEILVFDEKRGHLLVGDYFNDRIMIFSIEDGSLLSEIKKTSNNDLEGPAGLVIDHQNDLLFAVRKTSRICAWSLSNNEPVSLTVGDFVSGQLDSSGCLAIDQQRRQLIVIDSMNHGLQVFSLDDFSYQYWIDVSSHIDNFHDMMMISIDQVHDRLVIADWLNGFAVYSLMNNSFLFRITNPVPGFDQIMRSRGCCVINQGRIIIADTPNCCLRAFTMDGVYISSFLCPHKEKPTGVAFDSRRGLIAYSSDERVNVIGANQWLPDTFDGWSPSRHWAASCEIRTVVKIFTMLRSLELDCDYPSIILLPNELLFEIFWYL